MTNMTEATNQRTNLRTNLANLSFCKILGAAFMLALALTSSAHSIVRVKAPPEVGRHVFEGSFGISGSLEEAAAGEDVAWSFGWSYHANNALGVGITIGANKPEAFSGGLILSSLGVNEAGRFENKFSYLTANIHVRAPTRSGLVPRVQAGFGYYQIEFEFRPTNPGGFSDLVDKGEFGMHYGIGLDYLITENLALGVIGNYHLISLDKSSPLTDLLGDWYDTWDLKASVSFYVQ